MTRRTWRVSVAAVCAAAAAAAANVTAGACYKGTPAYPESGFQWFGR